MADESFQDKEDSFDDPNPVVTTPRKGQRHIGFDIGFQSFAFTIAILSADGTTLHSGAKELFRSTHINRYNEIDKRGLLPENPNAMETQRLLQDGILINPCDAADFILEAIEQNVSGEEDTTVDRLHVTVPDTLAPNSRLRLLKSLRASAANRSKTQVNKDEPDQGIDFGGNVEKAITLGPRSQALALWNVAFAGVKKDKRSDVTISARQLAGTVFQDVARALEDGQTMILYTPLCGVGYARIRCMPHEEVETIVQRIAALSPRNQISTASSSSSTSADFSSSVSTLSESSVSPIVGVELDARIDIFRGRVRPGLAPTEDSTLQPKGWWTEAKGKKLEPKHLLPADLIHSEVIHNVLGDGKDAQCRRNAVEQHFGIGKGDIRIVVSHQASGGCVACPQFHAEHALVLSLMASPLPAELMSDTDEDSSDDDESDKQDDTAANPLSDDLSSDGEGNRSKTTAFFRNQVKQFNSLQTWLTVLLVFLLGVLIQAQLVIVENKPFGGDF